MSMFDEALSLIGPEPKPISNEEFRSRQRKLFSQFDENELLILCSSPEQSILMMFTTHIVLKVI